MAGWFSKQATEKLAELFESLFRTRTEYEDKLSAEKQPVILKVEPSPVPAPAGAVPTDTVLSIAGENFQEGAGVELGKLKLATVVKGPGQLNATVPVADRPPSGTEQVLQVLNPAPMGKTSEPYKLRFL